MSIHHTRETLSEFKQYELDLYRASNIGGVYTVRMDEQFTLLYGNDLFFRVHEFEPEELLGKSCGIFIHPQDLAHVHSVLANAQEHNVKHVEWEMRIITGKKNLKHMLVSGSFNTRDGEEVFDGYITDISKQKEMEVALRASEEKFRVATENSDVSFWTYDFARKEIIQPQASKTRHGYERIVSDVPNAFIEAGYIREDSVKPFLEMYEQLRNGAKTCSGDFWFRTTNNKGWWCEHIDYTNVFDENGRPVCAHAIGRDVTSIKLAERRYREEMEYSRATQSDNLLVKVRSNITQNVVESYAAKDAVGISRDGMSYIEGTEALAQTGFTEEEQNLIRRYLNRDRVLKAFAEGETGYRFDYRRKTHDGDVIWVNTTVKTYQNPDTKDIMSFMYTYDINDSKIKDGIIQAVSTIEHDYIAWAVWDWRIFCAISSKLLLPSKMVFCVKLRCTETMVAFCMAMR